MEGRNLVEVFRALVPALSYATHKGQAGRIGVVGGSIEYTGAPYFAAMSAMRVGADLSHVFCPAHAATVIKSYSPDLIVHPLLNDNSMESVPLISSWFGRLHAVNLGPGLGRSPSSLQTAKGLLWSAVMQQKPLVVDADGLFLLSQEPDLVKNYEKAVLTPNMMEMKRLYFAVFKEDIPNMEPIENAVKNLACRLGHVTIILKGEEDIITNGKSIFRCTLPGCPRRCGGQGDLLSGVLTVFLYWAYQNSSEISGQADLHSKLASLPAPILASYSACHLIKLCSQTAFEKHKRSMVASDMLSELPHIFDQLFENVK